MKKTLYALLVVAAIALVLLVIMASGNDSQNSEINYTVEGDCYSIKTDFCDLQYPLKWKNQTDIIYNTEEAYTVEFYSGEVHLFDVIFNGDESKKIGNVVHDDKSFSIGIESYSLEKEQYDEGKYNEYCTMQEDLNVILSKLVEDYNMVLE